MTKKDFIEKYAAKTGVSKKVASEFVEAFLETVEEVVVSGENVQFVGFGSFEARNTAERKGRNPKTGKKIKVKIAGLADDATVKFSWSVNGKKIKGAKGKALKLTKALKG